MNARALAVLCLVFSCVTLAGCAPQRMRAVRPDSRSNRAAASAPSVGTLPATASRVPPVNPSAAATLPDSSPASASPSRLRAFPVQALSGRLGLEVFATLPPVVRAEVDDGNDPMATVAFHLPEGDVQCVLLPYQLDLNALLTRALKKGHFVGEPSFRVRADQTAALVLIHGSAEVVPPKTSPLHIAARLDDDSTMFCAADFARSEASFDSALERTLMSLRVRAERPDAPSTVLYSEVREVTSAGSQLGFARRSLRMRPSGGTLLQETHFAFERSGRSFSYYGVVDAQLFGAKGTLEKMFGQAWAGASLSRRWQVEATGSKGAYDYLITDGTRSGERRGNVTPELPFSEELLMAPALRELAEGKRSSLKYSVFSTRAALPKIIELKAAEPGTVLEMDDSETDELYINDKGAVAREMGHPITFRLLAAAGNLPQ
jgi:hypothetical protein